MQSRGTRHTCRPVSTRVYSTASKRHSYMYMYIMRCCVGPQNPSVADDISKRAVTVVIGFPFSTCCCPCKTSDTATLLAHPKLPVVARMWHVYTYSRAHRVLPSNQYFPRKRMFCIGGLFFPVQNRRKLHTLPPPHFIMRSRYVQYLQLLVSSS